MRVRVAEDPEVSLPVMVNVDGFNLTHVIEPIEFWTKDMVKQYLPAVQADPSPASREGGLNGAFGMPEIYSEQKMAHDVVLANSTPTILKGMG